MMKTRDIWIDADHILYNLASPPSEAWRSRLKGKSIVKPTSGIKKLKESFKARIASYEDIAQVEAIAQNYKIGSTNVVISDASNFRYDISPDYKANRKGKEHTDEFLKLRKWARKKWSSKENIEADDKVAYHVRKGGVGFSGDKDLCLGVAGIWFDTYHKRRYWLYTSKKSAKRFNLIQMIAGDLGDGIRGIEGVGFVTAEKLLNKHGWNWYGVTQAYLEKGYSVYDAIMTRRLVSMTQWSPKKGLQIFGDDDE